MALEVVASSTTRELAHSQLEPPRFEYLKARYQSICEQQRQASLRNTSLLQDLSSLRRRVQLVQETATAHLTKFTSLKSSYEEFVATAHTQWMKLATQQPSTTPCCYGNRQPDSLITRMGGSSPQETPLHHNKMMSTAPPLQPASILPPLPHISFPPPTAAIVVATSSKPHPLTSTNETSGRQPQATEQFLLTQHNNSGASAPLLPHILRDTYRETGSLQHYQDGMAASLQPDQDGTSHLNVKLSALVEQSSSIRQPLENSAVRHASPVQQTTSAGKITTTDQASVKGAGASETISDSASKEATGMSSVGRVERKIELFQPQLQIMNHEEMKNGLGLSSLSLSPSPTDTVDLSSTSATPISLFSQSDHSQLEGSRLPLPLENMSVDVDSLSVEDIPAAESALQLGREVKTAPVEAVKNLEVSSVRAKLPPKRSSSSSRSLQPGTTSASQPDLPTPVSQAPLTPASQPVPPLTDMDKNGSLRRSLSDSCSEPTSVAAAVHAGSDGEDSDGGGEEEDPASLVTNEEIPVSLSANKEDPANLATNEEDPASLVTDEEDPANLATNEKDPASLVTDEEDSASLVTDEKDPANHAVGDEDPASLVTDKKDPANHVADDQDPASLVTDKENPAILASGEEDPANLVVDEGDPASQAASGENPSSVAANEGRTGNTSVTIIINLISTLKQHLAEDAESADIMFTLPSSSDNMKSQISSSEVLTSNLIKMAVGGKDMSTWEPGAVSMVLLQQLGHMTNSVGSLLPQKLLDKDAPLLTSFEELSVHLGPLWSLVWPVLFEYIHLMVECGRTKSDLATTFTPAVVHTANPTHREKARQHLLSVLEGHAKGFPPSSGIMVRGESPSSSEGMTSQPSLEEGVENGQQHRHDGLEMATTVFGGEVELSQPSSLISEESAIAQIEKELQEVVSGSRHSDEKENKKKLHLASFNTPPLHFDPSNSSESTDNDDLSDGAPQSSPCYVPTATEQRSSLVISQASNHSSLRRRLGLLGDSDSGSDLDDSLLHLTTPPSNHSVSKQELIGAHKQSTAEVDLEPDDFDFYG